MGNLKNMFLMAGLSEDDATLVFKYFKKKTYQKNEYLLRPGNIATHIYYIETGGVILGNMTDKKPITRHRALASEFITCLESFHNKSVTDEYLKSSTCSEVYEINKGDFDSALKQFPILQNLYQKFVFELLVKCQKRINDLISQDAYSYLEQLNITAPAIIQNMNQYDLASYMGIEPQSLSRLRGKRAKKKRIVNNPR
uniref:Putative transcriptional regulator, Crp/Fnr family n=1 Tax=Sphingobacterium sp. (strain 21) TaxID=743722 RepID=F4C2R1_SPHS2